MKSSFGHSRCAVSAVVISSLRRQGLQGVDREKLLAAVNCIDIGRHQRKWHSWTCHTQTHRNNEGVGRFAQFLNGQVDESLKDALAFHQWLRDAAAGRALPFA